jgi:hypothetical protein
LLYTCRSDAKDKLKKLQKEMDKHNQVTKAIEEEWSQQKNVMKGTIKYCHVPAD